MFSPLKFGSMTTLRGARREQAAQQLNFSSNWAPQQNPSFNADPFNLITTFGAPAASHVTRPVVGVKMIIQAAHSVLGGLPAALRNLARTHK
jgi:hypothetical protein